MTRTIKMRLLKQGNDFTVDSSLKDNHGLQEVAWDGIAGARLFVGSVYTNPPPWLDFLSQRATGLPDLSNSGCAAILFIPVDNRTLAICFGHAHLVINERNFERNFGLKVTLNMVHRDHLRSIDAATPDATTIQKRVQASRNSDLALFGIDYDRDLVSEVAGVPQNNNFAKFLAGRDSLSITCELTSTGIQDKCREALAAYQSQDYQTHYSWIDHIQPVRDKAIIEDLDNTIFAAIEALRQGTDSDLHLAPPEIVNYMEGTDLRYNGIGATGGIYQQLAIEDYIADLQSVNFAGDIESIKTAHKISAKSTDTDRFTEKWRLYDCFVFETDWNNGQYVLFGGQWFCVERTFADEIEAFFTNIPRVNIIAHTNKKNEKELIELLDSNTYPDLLKLDCELISAAGLPYDSIEACDFFSQNRQFIHLKDGHSSGPISHLWMQGVVSAEAFAGNRAFRQRLREKIRRLDQRFVTLIPDGRTNNITRSEFTVVYGIMRKPYRNGTLSIPFFSKVSLRSAVQRIEILGFPVAINLIEKR